MEDEEVNMNTAEVEEPEEEIELLDFLVPDNSKIEFADAKKLIDDLVNTLNSNYKVILNAEEGVNNLKYVINIEKKEE